MVAEPEHERNRAHIHHLGQGELDGCGVALSHERRPSVLQGDGGDAVGGYPSAALRHLPPEELLAVGDCPTGSAGRLAPPCDSGGGRFDLFAICEYNTRHD